MTDTAATTAATADPVQKIIVTVEHAVHQIEVEIEAGWKWVEDEFTHLKHEANVLYQWAAKADPQIQSVLHAAVLDWEAAAARAAAAGSGFLGNLISNEGATIETGIANFAQGVLKGVGQTDNLTPSIGLLFQKGEGILLDLVKSNFAKVLASVVAPGA